MIQTTEYLKQHENELRIFISYNLKGWHERAKDAARTGDAINLIFAFNGEWWKCYTFKEWSHVKTEYFIIVSIETDSTENSVFNEINKSIKIEKKRVN